MATVQRPDNSNSRNVSHSDQVLVALIANAWVEEIRRGLEFVVAETPGAALEGLDLAVQAVPYNETKVYRRPQQATNTSLLYLSGTGVADFAMENNPAALVNQVQAELPEIISKQNLQQALDDVDTVEQVQVVNVDVNTDTDRGNPDAIETPPPPTKTGPTVVEIAIGFALLALTLTTLVFWGWVLHQKYRQRRVERRRAMMQHAAKNGPVLIPAAPTAASSSTLGRAVAPVMSMPASAIALQRAESESSSESSYRGLGSDDDDKPLPSSPPLSDEADLDAFGRALQQAASADQAAWEEYQRKKQQGEAAADNAWSSSRIVLYEAAAAARPDGNTAPVERTRSFPYGDDSVADSSDADSTAAAVPWSTSGLVITGVAPAAAAAPDSGAETTDDEWEPYGDGGGKKIDPPPSQFSFMYPLNGQNLSQEVEVVTGAADDQTDAAIRLSPDATTLSNEKFIIAPEIASTETDSDDTDNQTTNATLEMVKEVERLSMFVKQYEQRKSLTSGTTAAEANPDTVGRNQSDEDLLLGNSASLSEGGVSDDEESQFSSRLGILRFSVQKPPAPLLSYRAGIDAPTAGSDDEQPPTDEESLVQSDPTLLQRRSALYPSALLSTGSRDAASDDDEVPTNAISPNASPPDPSPPAAAATRTPEPPSAQRSSRTSPQAMLVDVKKKLYKSQPSAQKSPSSNDPTVSPSTRRSRAFESIVKMFEGKPKNPVVPPPLNNSRGAKR
jgi:hypothetical protein